MPTQSVGTIVNKLLRLSFPTLQRGNALRDAPRHRSAPRCTVKIGRRASRTACRRRASARSFIGCGALAPESTRLRKRPEHLGRIAAVSQ
ncbi:DUF1534 domain-containing protein [Pseudomonas syringae]|nr:DUF1534 domain-containing protein [Pseudomonas syringae]MCF5538650.1 DUF1534 domain-containing protein [Pseudomonas syringae]MCF5670148.1 DUF1534 domain-containing protein [Pseudomonas syringae]MCF5823192.1 DUF1534 domain-containing protein [Pseudomonas syringae]